MSCGVAGYGGATSAPGLPRRQPWARGMFVFRFPLVHLGIGIAGNALFLVGTVLFLARRRGPPCLGASRRALVVHGAGVLADLAGGPGE